MAQKINRAVKKKSCWQIFRKWMKARDLFGHEIRLNFNQKGDTHRTFPGGCMTILAMFAMCYILLAKILMLVKYGKDEQTSNQQYHDLLERGKLSFEDLNVINFIEIWKDDYWFSKDPEPWEKYLNITAVVKDWSWDPNKQTWKYIDRSIKLRPCIEDDFNKTDETLRIFKRHLSHGQKPICIDNPKEVYLLNNWEEEVGASLYIYIDKCTNSSLCEQE